MPSGGAVDVKCGFWDLSGHSEFHDVRTAFYGDAQALVLVYDVTSRESFEALDLWLEEATACGAGAAVRVLCANKCDLGKARRVTEKEGAAWAATHNFRYFETSAKSGRNVAEVFTHAFEGVVARLERNAASIPERTAG